MVVITTEEEEIARSSISDIVLRCSLQSRGFMRNSFFSGFSVLHNSSEFYLAALHIFRIDMEHSARFVEENAKQMLQKRRSALSCVLLLDAQ